VRDFGGLTVINAGTLYRNHKPRVLLVDFASGEVEVYSFDEYELNPDSRKLTF
jgi:hypothetical protein